MVHAGGYAGGNEQLLHRCFGPQQARSDNFWQGCTASGIWQPHHYGMTTEQHRQASDDCMACIVVWGVLVKCC
jgi:hypothetical protein